MPFFQMITRPFRQAARDRLVLAAVLMSVLVAGWQFVVAPGPERTVVTVRLLLLGGAFQALLWLTLVAVTGRPLFSLAAFALAVTALVVSNGLSYRYNGLAIMPVDARAVLGMARDVGLFRRYMALHWIALLALLCVVSLSIACAVLEPPVLRWTRKTALPRLVAIVGILLLFYPPESGSSVAYRALSAAGGIFSDADPNASVERNGLFAHLVLGLPGVPLRLPDGGRVGDATVFTRALADAGFPRAAGPGSPRPHIVVILEESFFDPRRLDVTFDPPLLRRFDAVTAGARYHGNVSVSVFGGNTVESEFSFLTGLPTKVFGQAARWPFQSLVTDRTWSIARYLDQLGYDTVGVYPVPGTLFGAEKAYRQLGFRRFLAVDTFDPQRDFEGESVTDGAVARKVVEIIRKATRPTFVFALTMENHGPWGDRPGDSVRGRHRVKGRLTAENRAMLEDYVARLTDVENLVETTDRELRSLGTPAVLAVFGDHLPALVDTFRQVGFTRPGQKPDTARSGPEWFRTPYFVSTYPPSGAPVRVDMDISLLGPTVLDAAGVNDDPFFQNGSAFRGMCGGQIQSCKERPELWKGYVQTLYDHVRDEGNPAITARAEGLAYRFGTPIIPGTDWLGGGWVVDAAHTWTVGAGSTIALRLAEPAGTRAVITARVAPNRVERAQVIVNGEEVAVWHFSPGAAAVWRTAFVPRAAIGDARTVLVAFRPVLRQEGKSEAPDDPHAGLAFESLTMCVPSGGGCPQMSPADGTWDR